jgi:hypothetical protein
MILDWNTHLALIGFKSTCLTKSGIMNFFKAIMSVKRPATNVDLYEDLFLTTVDIFSYITKYLDGADHNYTPRQIGGWLSKDPQFGPPKKV